MWLAILLKNVGIVNFFIPSTLHSRKIMGIEVNLAGAINTTAKGLVRSTKARYKSFSKGQVAALRPAVDSYRRPRSLIFRSEAETTAV